MVFIVATLIMAKDKHTTVLAVMANLAMHMVVIKGTVHWIRTQTSVLCSSFLEGVTRANARGGQASKDGRQTWSVIAIVVTLKVLILLSFHTQSWLVNVQPPRVIR